MLVSFIVRKEGAKSESRQGFVRAEERLLSITENPKALLRGQPEPRASSDRKKSLPCQPTCSTAKNTHKLKPISLPQPPLSSLSLLLGYGGPPVLILLPHFRGCEHPCLSLLPFPLIDRR